MDIHLTTAQAWEDFYKWMQDKKTSGEFARLPGDVQEANYAYLGRRKSRLGDSRIKMLLNKYAPDRYEFKGGFILHDEKSPE